VGNGAKISIQHDRWLPEGSNSKVYYPIPDLSATAKVKELIDKENGGWKMELVRRCFMLAEVQAITSI
jgi:hypothetical protein